MTMLIRVYVVFEYINTFQDARRVVLSIVPYVPDRSKLYEFTNTRNMFIDGAIFCFDYFRKLDRIG